MRSLVAVPKTLDASQGILPFVTRVYNWFEQPHVALWNIATVCGLFFVFTVLASCAALERNPATAKIATQYAVAKFVENSAIEKRDDRRKRIVSIAGSIKSAAQNTTSTLQELQTIAYGQIDALDSISPADKVLAKALVDFIAEEIKLRTADKQLQPEHVVVIGTFMDWIIQAAQL